MHNLYNSWLVSPRACWYVSILTQTDEHRTLQLSILYDGIPVYITVTAKYLQYFINLLYVIFLLTNNRNIALEWQKLNLRCTLTLNLSTFYSYEYNISTSLFLLKKIKLYKLRLNYFLNVSSYGFLKVLVYWNLRLYY